MQDSRSAICLCAAVRGLGQQSNRGLEYRKSTVGVGADSDPAKGSAYLTHRPEIKISAETIAGSIERGGSGDAAIAVGGINERRFKTPEVF